MSAVWTRGLTACAVALLIAGLTWLVAGAAWGSAALIICSAAMIGYFTWHLDRLTRWATSDAEVPVPEAHGPWAVAFSALHRRVRQRTAQQRDLAHTIDRMKSAVDAIPDGIAVLDGANRLRWANRRAQAHLGVDIERDIGQPIANLVRHPEITRYLERGDFSDAITVESQRDARVTLSIQVVPFGGDERLLISRDISQLEAVERMRRDFIANVSHELKTPLTVVSGFAETLHDMELDSASRQRYLELMQEQARNMKRLVDDLLTLSRLESQGSEAVEQPFPMHALLEELAAEARALSGGAHHIEIDRGPAAEVLGSGEELRSAFANLISNAIRYTPAGGQITLRWRVEPDGTGVFSVLDTGIGVAPEHIPRLTERFYRVDRSRSRATGGTGLGLAIVKHVLIRHDADLMIESTPGRGSTFSVRLPTHRVRVQQDTMAKRNDADTMPTAPSSPRRSATARP